jgi:hypothetical protein
VLLEKIFGRKFEDIMGESGNYIKKSIIECALANYYGSNPREPKYATLVIHISEFTCPFKLLARRL